MTKASDASLLEVLLGLAAPAAGRERVDGDGVAVLLRVILHDAGPAPSIRPRLEQVLPKTVRADAVSSSTAAHRRSCAGTSSTTATASQRRPSSKSAREPRGLRRDRQVHRGHGAVLDGDARGSGHPVAGVLVATSPGSRHTAVTPLPSRRRASASVSIARPARPVVRAPASLAPGPASSRSPQASSPVGARPAHDDDARGATARSTGRTRRRAAGQRRRRRRSSLPRRPPSSTRWRVHARVDDQHVQTRAVVEHRRREAAAPAHVERSAVYSAGEAAADEAARTAARAVAPRASSRPCTRTSAPRPARRTAVSRSWRVAPVTSARRPSIRPHASRGGAVPQHARASCRHPPAPPSPGPTSPRPDRCRRLRTVISPSRAGVHVDGAPVQSIRE